MAHMMTRMTRWLAGSQLVKTPLETGMYNLRFYTLCDFPCFLHQYSAVTNLGKTKTPFLVLQK